MALFRKMRPLFSRTPKLDAFPMRFPVKLYWKSRPEEIMSSGYVF